MKKIVLLLLLLTASYNFAQVSYPPVKGAWLTNVDSDVLTSKKKIQAAVDLCEETGLNTIFVVVWNKAMTMYPSKVMENMFGEPIDPIYPGRDPLKELIDAAHKKNIKVIAWFEFGFSSSYMLNGGRLIKLHPDWASRNNEGKIVQKNGFEWMNGFNPEVQDFMLSLLVEVAKNYDVDGIQGDDRLPAMPVEAGYEDYTVQLYKSEHNGANPPQNFRDTAWVTWRANKMNDFMERIYKEVKAVKKDIIISMAPSLFPWSKEEYLQDWPTWLRKGLVEMVCPQLYRYTEKEYIQVLDETLKSQQIRKEDLKKFFPGILLKLGSYYASEDYLKTVIKENRKRGVEGEVYFFFEGIRKYPKFFKKQYKNN